MRHGEPEHFSWRATVAVMAIKMASCRRRKRKDKVASEVFQRLRNGVVCQAAAAARRGGGAATLRGRCAAVPLRAAIL